MAVGVGTLFREVLRGGKTLARVLLMDALSGLLRNNQEFDSDHRVLELGGLAASHQRTYPVDWQIIPADLNPGPDVQHVFDASAPFPLDDQSFDGVVFFHTLYAVPDQLNCLTESIRTAGKFVIFNAPLNQILSPHPRDIHRHTEASLINLLDLAAKKVGPFNRLIIPVGGSFSSATTLIDPFLKFRPVRFLVYWLALKLDNLDRFTARDCPQQYLVALFKVRG